MKFRQTVFFHFLLQFTWLQADLYLLKSSSALEAAAKLTKHMNLESYKPKKLIVKQTQYTQNIYNISFTNWTTTINI